MESPRLHIILFQPEIPQNTGNIGRVCAFTGARLHLIRPLGFSISDRHLKRSGMDYWQALDWHVHDSWEDFKASSLAPQSFWLLTTHASNLHWSATFQHGDGLVFGNEGHGAPQWLHDEIGDSHRIRIPAFSHSPLRSLNLASSVGITAYEALRQWDVECERW